MGQTNICSIFLLAVDSQELINRANTIYELAQATCIIATLNSVLEIHKLYMDPCPVNVTLGKHSFIMYISQYPISNQTAPVQSLDFVKKFACDLVDLQLAQGISFKSVSITYRKGIMEVFSPKSVYVNTYYVKKMYTRLIIKVYYRLIADLDIANEIINAKSVDGNSILEQKDWDKVAKGILTGATT